jgi:hypothetical protein
MGGHDLGVTSPDRAAGRTSGLGEARLLVETAFGAYVCRRSAPGYAEEAISAQADRQVFKG